MQTTRRSGRWRRRRAASLTAVVALAVLAAGCSDDPDDEAGTDPDPTSTASSDVPPTEPTEPSEPTEPTESAEPEPSEPAEPTATDGGGTDSPPARAQGSAIKAGALPGFNAEWTWEKDGSGSGPGHDQPSVCMVSSLTAIGAVTEFRTDYESDLDDDSWAVVSTAVFPDELTVERSADILAGWLQSCAKQAKALGLKRVDVGPVHTVDTVVGEGRQRLVTYRPVAGDPNASWFQAEGFVRDGDTITYAIVTTAGQDYNYEVGAEPMDQILKVAAKRLAKSRS